MKNLKIMRVDNSARRKVGLVSLLFIVVVCIDTGHLFNKPEPTTGIIGRNGAQIYGFLYFQVLRRVTRV